MSTLYEQNIVVMPQHVDALGHVNNVVYVQWMQDIALQHSEQLGLSLQNYQALNHAMVASEHHVKYRKACLLDDQLIMRTWLSDLTAFSSLRHYILYRKLDKTIVFQANTLWVCVEISTGKLKRLSPTFTQTYQPLDVDIDPLSFED